MNDRGRSVLVSGAGIAGSSLAFLLAERGFRVTVVERARDLRSSGTPVDVEGEAFDVAGRIGVVGALRACATRVQRMVFLDRRGRRAALHFPLNGPRHIEVPRADLARILCGAARSRADVVFDESVTRLDQDAGGVEVSFERAAPARFDYVVGCDGLHSNVRALAFAAGDVRVDHLGMYVATFPLGRPAERADEIVFYNVPNRAISIHPGTGQAIAALMFRAGPRRDLDPRDAAAHRAFLEETYRDAGWCARDLLDRLRGVADFYFDAVTRIRLPGWSRGRVALLGDAASCVSFLGGGSSSAVVGAARLADALAAAPGDHALAFREYERTHRQHVDPKQRGVHLNAHLLIPATTPGIAARNVAARLYGYWTNTRSVAKA